MVGYSNATYLLVTGKRFAANSQVLNGLFAELLPKPSDVFPRAIEIAQDIVENVSSMALHLNRQMIWRDAGSAERAHLIDSPVLYDMFSGKYVLDIDVNASVTEPNASSDHVEFKKSFFAKRPPKFTDTLARNAPRTYPWWTELSVDLPLQGDVPSEPKL